MNKFIIPLLACCVVFVAQNSPCAMEEVIKKDTSTGTPQKQKVHETAKAELFRLLNQPLNLEEDQEPRILRIKQLKEQISAGSSDLPPRTPPRYVSNQHVIDVGNIGKGRRGVDTEMLINLALKDIRLHPSELSKLTASQIGAAARAVTELVDPNMSLGETLTE